MTTSAATEAAKLPKTDLRTIDDVLWYTHRNTTWRANRWGGADSAISPTGKSVRIIPDGLGITVYAFDANEVLDWSAEFTHNTPGQIIETTVRTALELAAE
jgi:hypothetical protein